MASYHLSVKTIKRSAGRSATAAAAYRVGERIECQREGRVHDYASPFWMTIRHANALEAKVRKGEKSSVVVYYGQARSREDEKEADDPNEETASTGFRFQKAYRVFNADWVDAPSRNGIAMCQTGLG